jgi:starch synthase
MIAMRYGCLPVARAVGGLKDSIADHSGSEVSTGFLFDQASSSSLESALRRALTCFQDQNLWKGMQKTAMKQDFSWYRSAKEYAALYQRVMNKPLSA